MTHWAEPYRALAPCSEAWASALKSKSFRSWWRTCKQGDWMLWAMARSPEITQGSEEHVRLCWIVCRIWWELAYPYWYEYGTDHGDERPQTAMLALEDWCRNPSEDRAAEAAEAAWAAGAAGPARAAWAAGAAGPARAAGAAWAAGPAWAAEAAWAAWAAEAAEAAGAAEAARAAWAARAAGAAWAAEAAGVAGVAEAAGVAGVASLQRIAEIIREEMPDPPAIPGGMKP